MENPTSTNRTHLCSLCQQCYGSGLRDHVATADILRSRRMLLDRATANDPGVRQGLEQFLDDISKDRKSSDSKPRQFLSVCAFCTQLLPSVYQEDKLVDDLRHQLLSTKTTYSHPIATTRRKVSNLVIQHRLPKAPLRQQSMSASTTVPTPPPQPQTYRLLTDEITRVLQLDASTVRSSLAGQSNLMTGDAVRDLRQQERRQSTSILAARRATHEARLETAQQNYHFRGDDQSLSSDIHQQLTEKQSLVRTTTHTTPDGGASLYTGIVVHTPSTRRVNRGVAASGSQANVILRKHGRHFKAELTFPALLH